jgi:hypothetical protein
MNDSPSKQEMRGVGALRIPCNTCQTIVKRSPSTLKNAGGRAFCSQVCYKAYWKGKPRKPRIDTGVSRGAEYVEALCETCKGQVRRRKSDIKGQAVFCNHECRISWLKSRPKPGRPGTTELGREKMVSGYVYEYVGAANTAPGSKGYEAQHRLVMSRAIGRPLTKEETVHHKNGDRLDNRPENLELWVSRHPRGQRADELVAWAEEIIATYKPILPLLP